MHKPLFDPQTGDVLKRKSVPIFFIDKLVDMAQKGKRVDNKTTVRWIR